MKVQNSLKPKGDTIFKSQDSISSLILSNPQNKQLPLLKLKLIRLDLEVSSAREISKTSWIRLNRIKTPLMLLVRLIKNKHTTYLPLSRKNLRLMSANGQQNLKD
jgi:hypothetical protein